MKAEAPSYTASVPMGERGLPVNVPGPPWAREPKVVYPIVYLTRAIAGLKLLIVHFRSCSCRLYRESHRALSRQHSRYW
jgi:hypothetical protein